MGVFPSGQRGQTVNLLSSTSVVRIHPLPPKQKKTPNRVSFLFCLSVCLRTPNASFRFLLFSTIRLCPLRKQNADCFSRQEKCRSSPANSSGYESTRSHQNKERHPTGCLFCFDLSVCLRPPMQLFGFASLYFRFMPTEKAKCRLFKSARKVQEFACELQWLRIHPLPPKQKPTQTGRFFCFV